MNNNPEYQTMLTPAQTPHGELPVFSSEGEGQLQILKRVYGRSFVYSNDAPSFKRARGRFLRRGFECTYAPTVAVWRGNETKGNKKMALLAFRVKCIQSIEGIRCFQKMKLNKVAKGDIGPDELYRNFTFTL